MGDALQEKCDEAQIILDEIIKEMGSDFYVGSWMRHHTTPMVMVASLSVDDWACIGFKEPLSKTLICNRLRSTCGSMVGHLQTAMRQLQQIEEKN